MNIISFDSINKFKKPHKKRLDWVFLKIYIKLDDLWVIWTITCYQIWSIIDLKITIYMAFNEGGMASGLLIIAVSIVFAAGFGFLVLHFVPGTPF